MQILAFLSVQANSVYNITNVIFDSVYSLNTTEHICEQ